MIISGSQTAWKDVIAVYAVKIYTDPDHPQEVVTLDDSKIDMLKTIFWEMNEISSRTETKQKQLPMIVEKQ